MATQSTSTAHQDWNTRIVTRLLNSSKGDLILDSRGNLCRRDTWDINGKDLPWAQHTVGTILALINPAGWLLTADGAQYILENCEPQFERSGRTDVKRLAAIASI